MAKDSIVDAASNIAANTVSSSTPASAVSGLSRGATFAAGQGIVRSFRNSGFVLFALASFLFLLAQLFGVESWYVFASLGFMIFASIFIFRNKGLLVVLFVGVWYLFFDGIDLRAADFVTIALLIILPALIRGVIARFRKEDTFVHSSEEEIVVGLLLFFIFALDTGLLFVLANRFFETPLFITEILSFIPIWAYVGLFTIFRDEGENSTWLTKILAAIGVVYLLLIAFFVVGDLGTDTVAPSFLPTPEELASIKERQQFGVNPAVITFQCLFSDITAVSECVERKKAQEEYRAICRERGLLVTSAAFRACLEQEEAAASRSGVVRGSVSNLVSESLVVSLDFANDLPRSSTQPRELYPLELHVENPREEQLPMKVECLFRKGKQEITGKIFINGDEQDSLIVDGRRADFRVQCQPQEDLSGSYRLVYRTTSATQTYSFLRRAFVGVQDDFEQREELEAQIQADYFRSRNDRTSQAPDDPVRLNFNLGSGEMPYILYTNEPISFSFSVEGRSSEALRVLNYRFNGLLEQGFRADTQKIGDADCLDGGEIALTKSQTRRESATQLKSCFLQLPAGFEIEPGRFEIVTFDATAQIEFVEEKEVSIVVNRDEEDVEIQEDGSEEQEQGDVS